MRAVAIYDLVMHRPRQGEIAQATRGQEFEITESEFKRLSDPEAHPPAGAVAEPGTIAARELSKPVPAAVNPDEARGHVLGVARAHLRDIGKDLPGSTQHTPAHEDATKEQTGVDTSVEASRSFARRAPTTVEQEAAKTEAELTGKEPPVEGEPEQAATPKKSRSRSARGKKKS